MQKTLSDLPTEYMNEYLSLLSVDLSEKQPGARKIKVSETATLSAKTSPLGRVRHTHRIIGHHDHMTYSKTMATQRSIISQKEGRAGETQGIFLSSHGSKLGPELA